MLIGLVLFKILASDALPTELVPPQGAVSDRVVLSLMKRVFRQVPLTDK